jgi:hypothetical protein
MVVNGTNNWPQNKIISLCINNLQYAPYDNQKRPCSIPVLMDVIFQQLPPPPAPPSSAQPQHPVPNELSEELRVLQTWVPSIPYTVRTSPSFDTNSIILRNVEIFTPNYFFSEYFFISEGKLTKSDKILENLISFVEMESFKINQFLGKHVLKWPRHYYIAT